MTLASTTPTPVLVLFLDIPKHLYGAKLPKSKTVVPKCPITILRKKLQNTTNPSYTHQMSQVFIDKLKVKTKVDKLNFIQVVAQMF